MLELILRIRGAQGLACPNPFHRGSTFPCRAAHMVAAPSALAVCHQSASGHVVIFLLSLRVSLGTPRVSLYPVVASASHTSNEGAPPMNPILPVAGTLAVVILLWLFFRPPFGKNVCPPEYTDQRIVALTYDDGPNPPYTDQLLDVLAKHDKRQSHLLHDRESDRKSILKTVHRVIAEGTPDRQSYL